MSNIYERPTSSILLAWLLAGTIDALAAMIIYQVAPMPMFRFIASGAFGAAALTGGLGMALAGLAFHYLIALVWTILFYLLYPRIRIMRMNRMATGAVYGVLIWMVMNLLVLPASSVRQADFTLRSVTLGAVILVFAVGMPIALVIGKYYARKMK